MLIEPTKLVPELFHDLPTPVQAEQLCTFVNQTFQYKTAWTGEGWCTYYLPDGMTSSISADSTGRTVNEYGGTLAGRPAAADDREVRVRLRDDVPVDLVVAKGQEHVGEKVLAALAPK